LKVFIITINNSLCTNTVL